MRVAFARVQGDRERYDVRLTAGSLNRLFARICSKLVTRASLRRPGAEHALPTWESNQGITRFACYES
jgi:hypothetical protein